MVRIRLARYGRKNAPSFRVVVIDSRKKRNGKYIEKLGYYNPTENEDKVVIDKKRYDHWLLVGAQPSLAVKKLLKGTYKYKKYNPNEEKQEDNKKIDDDKSAE